MSMSKEQEERVHRALSVLVDATPTGAEFEDRSETDLASSPQDGFRLSGVWAFAAAFALVIVVGGLWAWVIGGQSPDVADGEPITSEQILEDGVVTDEEYWAGVDAAIECVKDAGFQARTVGLDESVSTGLQGHATVHIDNADGEAEAADEAWGSCREHHWSENVSLGWSVTLGQVDLTARRAEEEATFRCVERRTGQDFGELNYDRHDFLTTEGELAKESAYEFENHIPWMECDPEKPGNTTPLLELIPVQPTFRPFSKANPPTFAEYEQAALWTISCIESLGGIVAFDGIDSEVPQIGVPSIGIPADKMYVWAFRSEVEPGSPVRSGEHASAFCRDLFFEDLQTLYVDSATPADEKVWIDALRFCLIEEGVQGAETIIDRTSYGSFNGDVPDHCWPLTEDMERSTEDEGEQPDS